jgi:histidinol phosphatase-like enzyme (inositol monophosphatase family)
MPTPTTELTERLESAVAFALEASAIPRRYFLSDGLVIDRKADDSPVTRADKEAEEFLRARIDTACPDDTIIGEELPDKSGTSGFTWYLDPIDGTESFVRGVPLFGTMVALQHDGESVVGVIDFPALGEIVYAAQGSGAWWATNSNGASTVADLDRRPAHVSAVADLANAAVSTTGLAHLFEEAGVAEQWQALMKLVKVGRGYGDCYGHYLVATGRVDVMLDAVMNAWDNAALLPIVTEAGGSFTDIKGNAVIDGGSGLSTNGLLHDAVLAVLRN